MSFIEKVGEMIIRCPHDFIVHDPYSTDPMSFIKGIKIEDGRYNAFVTHQRANNDDSLEMRGLDDATTAFFFIRMGSTIPKEMKKIGNISMVSGSIGFSKLKKTLSTKCFDAEEIESCLVKPTWGDGEFDVFTGIAPLFEKITCIEIRFKKGADIRQFKSYIEKHNGIVTGDTWMQ